MTHRTDWQVLRTSDPLPGNVVDIKDAASNYQQISKAISDARSELERISSAHPTDEMLSEAVELIRDDAKNIKTGLNAVQGRYTVVATELDKVADSLGLLQEKANLAETDARKAKPVLDDANQRISTTSGQLFGLRTQQASLVATDFVDAFDLTNAKEKAEQNAKNIKKLEIALQDAKNDKVVAQKLLDDAYARLASALRDYDTIANEAAEKIRHQCDSDGLNSNWYEDFLKWVANRVIDALDFVLNILENIADAIASVFEAIEKIAQAIVDLAGDLERLAEALAKGLSSNDWTEFQEVVNNIQTHVLDLMEGMSDLADSLSTITGTLGAILSVIPVTAEIGVALSGISTILKGGSLLLDVGLAAGGRREWSDVGYKAAEFALQAATSGLSHFVTTAKIVNGKTISGPARCLFESLTKTTGLFNSVNVNPIDLVKRGAGVDNTPGWVSEAPYVYHNTNPTFNYPNLSKNPTSGNTPLGGVQFTASVVGGVADAGGALFGDAANSIHDTRNFLNSIRPK